MKTALLIVDFFTDFEFSGGDKLKKQAVIAARKLAKLKEKAKAAGLPVVYVNDNFAHWRDDFSHQVDRLLERNDEAGKIARLLRPEKEDYYVLKPQRSGFYSTPLDKKCQVLNKLLSILFYMYWYHL